MKKFRFTFLVLALVIIGYLAMNKNTLQVSTIPNDWISYSGNGIQFQYPKNFSGNVWGATTWPPKVTLVAMNQDPLALGCPILKQGGSPLVEVDGTTKNGINYFLYTGGDAGAGSLYSSYCYIIQGKTSYSVIDFEVRSHIGCGSGSCGAYCGTQFEQECKDFSMTKAIITPIENSIATIKFLK